LFSLIKIFIFKRYYNAVALGVYLFWVKTELHPESIGLPFSLEEEDVVRYFLQVDPCVKGLVSQETWKKYVNPRLTALKKLVQSEIASNK
jgi:hypothetical protein